MIFFKKRYNISVKGFFILIMIVAAFWYFDPGGFLGATSEKLSSKIEDWQTSLTSKDSSADGDSATKDTVLTKTPAAIKGNVATGESVMDDPSASEVTIGPPPEISLRASSIIIEDGDSLTLTWDIKNADSCKSSGFLVYGEMFGELKFNPNRDATYRLQCSGIGGEASKSIEVVVVPANLTGITLRSSSVDITSKDSVTLTWASVNASSCQGTNFSISGTKGKVTVSPNKTVRFRINCSNNTTGASAEDTVLVNVTYIDENPGPPDSTAPIISNGSPSGTFSATTTSVTLAVTTDEKASCKYTLFAGTGFEKMTAFSSSNATEHKTLVSEILPHAEFRYYVRCEDEAGNQNFADYLIKFIIGIPQ